MIQVGIFTAYFPYGLEETAKRIRSHGFNTVQLDLHFKDMDLSPGQITREKCTRIRETFRDANLPISAISGYTNILHPDLAERTRRVDALKEILKSARALGTPYVISETGTYNPTSDWDSHPKNKTPEAFDECRKVIAELAQYAYDHGAVFLLETYVNNVIGSVEETLKLFAAVDHPGLGLLMDPTNYFEAHNIDRMSEVLNSIFDALSDKIRISHAKDVKRASSAAEKHADIGDANALESHTFRGVGGVELPAPGLGALDYGLYLKRLAKHHPNIPIIMEHLDEADVPRAKRFVDGVLREQGSEVPSIYGKQLSRRELARHAGALSQFAGVRLVTLGDGVERGVRALEFRTGGGLSFTVLIDRAFDVADCEYRGAAIGWHSPTGFRHPGLHEYEGEGGLSWLRSLSGLMVTCGLDHTLFMHEAPAAQYTYGPRKSVQSSLHGRIGTIPGKLLGYGERWEGDECTLYCEGLVVQATVFGEDLHLVRRIEARVGSREFTVHDRVVNHGFYRTPHMLLYHVNLGHPVLAEGSRYVAPVERTVWAAHEASYRSQEVGYRALSGPRKLFHEQVWEHELGADADGRVPVAVINDAFDGGRGLGFLLETNAREFPCHFEWQNFQEGHYAVALEPSTHHVRGRAFAEERGELIWLEHGEERRYHTRFAVLDGAREIAEAEARIGAIARQPEDDYPAPSNLWKDLTR